MRRASYREGVRWIAVNDEAGMGDTMDEVEVYVTVAMLADIFGVDTVRVATDVLNERAKIDKVLRSNKRA